MSTLIQQATPSQTTSPAERLRSGMAATRVSLSSFGVRKALSASQRSQVAESFDASSKFLSATKKLIDTRDPTFRAVTTTRNRIVSYWKGISLPYPDPGVRLIRKDNLPVFENQMIELRDELQASVQELDLHFEVLKSAARDRLGSLYNESDYPYSLNGSFIVEWDYPSIEPPDYLRQLNPELYRQEQQRMVARFEQATKMAEEAFTNEFAKLISHLAERLSGSNESGPKIFRDSAVQNLHQFFERFRSLNVQSNEQLDELVNQARGIVSGVNPQSLRDQSELRGHIADELSQIQNSLDELLIDRPRRNLIRRPK